MVCILFLAHRIYVLYKTILIIIIFPEKYFKELIRQQNYFKAQLWQTCEDIRDLKNIGLNQANDNQRQESMFSSFTLPLETEEQLQEVEQYLKNQAHFEISVMHCFYNEYFNLLGI